MPPLVAAVEQLTEAGYLVLGPENAEEAAAILGELAFEVLPVSSTEVLKLRERAENLLAAFPPLLFKAEA